MKSAGNSGVALTIFFAWDWLRVRTENLPRIASCWQPYVVADVPTSDRPG
jgi:hypothetical protein